MKQNKIKIGLGLLAILAITLNSCYKKIDIPNTNQVAVTMNSGTNYVTGDLTLNPKDSIIFSYTITSDRDMKYVGIQKNATDNSTFVAGAKDTLTAANKNSYTATKRLAADSANGTYKFRVVALDASGFYLGSKEFVITVSADFKYFTVRVLQVPDTTTKVNNCYLSAFTGTTYSYTTGAANSAAIDLGYYYDTTKVMAGSPATLQPKGHTIYTLPANPFAPYDLSSWTKNATLLKASTVTFASITSAGAIRTACVVPLSSGTVTRYSQTDRAAASIASRLTGQVLVFKTVAGKYGVMTINYTNDNGPVHDSFINIDVKIEK